MKIENELVKINGIEKAVIDLNNELLYINHDAKVIGYDELNINTKKVVAKYEPHVRVLSIDKKIEHHADEEHGHHHHGDEDEHLIFGMTRLKFSLLKIIVSFALFIFSLFVPSDISKIMLLLAYVISGYDIVLSAVRNMKSGQFMDENFLMTIATFGAVYLGEYTEAVGVMLFYMTGEYLQDLAVDRSRKSIKDLINIRPDYANIEENGELIRVKPDILVPGDVIVVKQGERIPLDGIVISGSSQLDTKALTGESLPREVTSGDEILSGSVNLTSLIKIKVTKPFSESTVSRIMELVEKSSSQKGKTEKLITKFARVYTPIVVFMALIVAFIVPLILGQPFSLWIRKGLVFLVISCPCALVISIPLGFFGGIGLASKNGILVKGSNFLEEIRNIKTIVLDKTGTVTEGSFKVTEIIPSEGIDKDTLIKLAALAEIDSPHPIAKSITDMVQDLDRGELSHSEEIRGKGIISTLTNEDVLYAGNVKMMNELGISLNPKEGTVVYIARRSRGSSEPEYLGSVRIEDVIKDDSKKAVQLMKSMGVENVIMLSGDSKSIVTKVAEETGMTSHRAELLPQDKVAEFENLKKLTPKGGITAFAGDGLNDTPVLKMADIGISMGSIGSEAAVEASDVVLMDDSLMKIPLAMKISKLTNSVVMQNIIMAVGFKVVIMAYSLLFKENIWLAIFADVGVALLAV
ncbi:MAG: heavy metal translocating P-type ATPase, partial [Clostridiaceae bacterium]